MLKVNGESNRLTKSELEDYRENSGITELQYEIIKMRYYDASLPTIVAICYKLNISERKFNRELNKALMQIYRYCKTSNKL